MAPSALDLLVLTLNCAKELINVGIFAKHLQTALLKEGGGSTLPDVVVFSLQEVAPLGYSFVGGYFLNPYLARFEDAVNLAALNILDDQRDADVVSVTQTQPADRPKKPYSIVKSGNVGYTAIVLLARNPDQIKDVQEAEIGFGAADMGNKGAVGLRMLFEADDGLETQVTFVATHLAAMEWNLARRNANWASIVRGLTFGNPEDVVAKARRPSSAEDNGETRSLLHDENHHARLQKELHAISVFRPSSHLFVAGDLNYRISTTSPPVGASFPSLDPDSEHHYMHFWHLDQLTREKAAGRTLHGLSEAKVTFPPTYKYVVKAKGKDDEAPKWSFAPHRYPSWTDRVLYLDTPSSVDHKVDVKGYDTLPVIASSDHRGVYLRASVPLLSPGNMEGSLSQESDDPRVKLPLEIDPEAWERRAAARRKEVMVGWGMMIGTTWEGVLALGTLLAVGVGWYWYATSNARP